MYTNSIRMIVASTVAGTIHRRLHSKLTVHQKGCIRCNNRSRLQVKGGNSPPPINFYPFPFFLFFPPSGPTAAGRTLGWGTQGYCAIVCGIPRATAPSIRLVDELHERTGTDRQLEFIDSPRGWEGTYRTGVAGRRFALSSCAVKDEGWRSSFRGRCGCVVSSSLVLLWLPLASRVLYMVTASRCFCRRRSGRCSCSGGTERRRRRVGYLSLLRLRGVKFYCNMREKGEATTRLHIAVS